MAGNDDGSLEHLSFLLNIFDEIWLISGIALWYHFHWMEKNGFLVPILEENPIFVDFYST